MRRVTYFPLLMDRWTAGTRHLTYEQKGFYIDLLVWMFETGNPVKDSDHAARILCCDPRTSRRLLADLSPKFRRTSAGLRHKLVDELIRNGGKIRGLEANNFPADPDPDLDLPDLSDLPDPDKEKEKTVKKEKEKSLSHAPPDCPHQAIIALYHKHTPCRRIRTWRGQRPGLLRQLWREHPDLEWWQGFFEYVAESDWLCGRVPPRDGRAPFMADLEWLIRPNNFQRINEGKYHRHAVRKAESRGLRPADLH